ncbi:malto-oligosyltrehalose synthase [Candidatus Methylobacter oryzae]|uniref:Malto-oligosyltrehalose synthase n=1 Tax=Candidatus Methylobacter oryzae TaxID=2497749 RepID=A0ABY3CGY7_9GAMM|nr:malto-oligosyltrehalose synthase [Candidatus Methylobacter oryzae]TRX03307.1 malto-oligosyltrehalose synthase [Candidatus Methylobacter oryzae]
MTDPNRQRDIDIPVSTYRLQFNKHFTFADATHIVGYLRRLGISHCYVSPYLKARPGSTHGYDIVDHSELNPEIGSREDFERFIAELQRNGMGLITDIVPNHMAVMGSDNIWWLDVLENGQASCYASFFDIDWCPVKKTLQDKILLPVLGDHYGNILEQRELKLAFDAGQGEFSVYYHQHRFPADPQTYLLILGSQDEQLLNYFAADDPVLLEYQTIDNSFSKLPLCTDKSEEKIEERKRDKEVFKKQLAKLCADSPALVAYIDSRVEKINRVAGEGGELHALLEQQVYRLAYWRVAGDEINYRRFFDINELAGLRIEDEKVFAATHELILSLIAEGRIQGLRIDHADGLYDPVAYYQHLNDKIAAVLNDGAGQPPIYIVAEKIVANYEYLSNNWPIHGTTGYEFANIVNGVFIDSGAEKPLTHCYARFIEYRQDFDELVYQAKRLVMTTSLASELNVLANHLGKIADASSKTRDYTLYALRNALSEVIACFPVYRTYINSYSVSKEDSQYIKWAVDQGKQRSWAADKTVFEFIRQLLLLEHNPVVADGELLRFVMKFQQYTPQVMAKGYEDTALYRYNRLISLNEVGGDPRGFGNSLNTFHHFNQSRLKKWPHTMLCLSTHDTKRSADVRARINVLTEIPQQWQEAVLRWQRLNRFRKTKMNKIVIARNDEYLFYQVLIGTWPLTHLSDAGWGDYQQRIRAYMIKAIREAKQYSSWLNPNEEYEQAVTQFVCRCLDPNVSILFLKDFTGFEKRIRKHGLYNALAQVVLLLTSPGVPDIYQGNECWQFTLVDPDNRRPVDFNKNNRILTEMETDLAKPDLDRPRFIGSLLENIEDGRIKLFVIMQTLGFRHRYAGLFKNGDYLKINVYGARADRLLAFARQDRDNFVVVVVPRLNDFNSGAEDAGTDSWLELPHKAPRRYRELFSQCRVRAEAAEDCLRLFVSEPLQLFPFAILSGVIE